MPNLSRRSLMSIAALAALAPAANSAFALDPAKNTKDMPMRNQKFALTREETLDVIRRTDHAVLSLAESLYSHAIHILSFLPATQVTSRGNADRDALVQCMGERFTRAEFIHRAEEMGIKPETASTWLKRLQKHGLVESTDRNGTYRKPGKR